MTTKILVIEEERDTAEAIEKVLAQIGHNVAGIARSLEEALRLIAVDPPDLMLMDRRLADSSSAEFGSGSSPQTELPIVYYSLPEDGAETLPFLDDGPFTYVVDPFDQRELNSTIEVTLYKHQMEAKLKRLEHWLTSTVNSVGDAVIATNEQGLITFLNPVAELLTGWKRSDALDHPVAEIVQIIDAETSLPLPCPTHQALQEGIAIAPDGKTILICRNGTEIQINYSTAAIRDECGKTRGSVLVFREITPQERLNNPPTWSALHDPLTGLPNRSLFLDRLQRTIDRARRHHGYRFAVLFLDLDRFKGINDTFGHLVGDEVLIRTAHTLEGCLRSVDTVARWGGDEFALLLEDLQQLADATRVAERIHRELAVPFSLNHQVIQVYASIGIVLCGAHCAGSDQILRQADAAMYRAKLKGPSHYEVFDPLLQSYVQALCQWQTDLQQALDNQQLQVYFDPIRSLASQRIEGFEAVLRWHHPEQGIISLEDLLGITEETGWILSAREWMLLQSCHRLVQWQALVPHPPLSVSLSLSLQQWLQPHLVDQVASVLQQTGCDPAWLRLEVTEECLLNQLQLARVRLDQLKSLGLQLCLTHFGAGYSCLSHLTEFPFDWITLDPSLVRRITAGNRMKVVRAITQLAEELDLQVIAKGIETADQLALLQQLHGHFGQGPAISETLVADAVEGFLQGAAGDCREP